MSRKRCVMYLCAAVAACSAGQARAEGLMTPSLSIDPAVAMLDEAATQPTAWVDQVKNPAPWLTWGADERIRIEYGNNFITLNEQTAGHERDYFRYRTRVWASLTPFENFSFNTRLIWEGRHFQNPQPPEWNNGQVEFDMFNIKLNVPQIATNFTVGRQDMFLGDGWLVADGTNGDGSRTAFFNAFRSTTEFKDIQTTADLIFIQNYSSPDIMLPSLGDTDRPNNENNERGAIVWLTNKSIENVELNPYFIYKHARAILPTKSDNADIYMFGTRAVAQLTENVKGRVESGAQFGWKDGQPICAWGLNSRLSYNFNDPYKNELRLNCEFLSGDNPNTERNEAFDSMWGRWPQFNELVAYAYTNETRIFDVTNLMRFGAGYAVQPFKDATFELNYNALFADQNTLAGTEGYTSDGNFRGHAFGAILRYKINRHLSGHVMGEYFVPGNYYDETKRDNAVFLRAELVLTF